MAGIRWSTVVPFSIAILTIVAVRNMFVYVDYLPKDQNSRKFSFLQSTAEDRMQLAYRLNDQRVADKNEMKLFGKGLERFVYNDEKIIVSQTGKWRDSEGIKLHAFQLFSDDENERQQQELNDQLPVEQVHNERPVNFNLDDFDKDVDKNERQMEIKQVRGFNLNDFDNDVDKNERKLKHELGHQRKTIDETFEHSEKNVLEKLAANPEIKQMGQSYDLDANSSFKHNVMMMANMGQVGKIVKQIKQSADHLQADKADLIPVKQHPFKYIINSPKICETNDEIFIVVYVHTAPAHYKRRMVIRQTWGDTTLYEVTVRLVFVMGIVMTGNSDRKEQNALMFEAEQYGDIVQEDFVDTYHNLTHKGVAALKWIDKHCGKAVFVLKTDDDIFVNMYTLIRYLKRVSRTSARPRGILMCLVWESMPVLREGKWKVTKEEWPDDSYPTYCSGSAFIMSVDVAIAMHRISYEVPFFWVDDFYITGLLPLKLGNITHRQFSSAYVLNGDLLEKIFTGPQWYTHVFSHVNNLDRIQAVWETLKQLVTGQVKPTIQSRTG